MENSFVINELRCKVDWIRVTLHDESLKADHVMEILGYSPEEFHKAERGAQGYMVQHQNMFGLSILSEGNEGMGIHINICGSAMSDCLEHYANSRGIEPGDGLLIDFINTLLLYEGKFTRIDLATDDIGGMYYTVDELEELLRCGKAVESKWRSWRPVADYDFDGNLITGKTVYLGKGSSNLMLRVYDKQAEQNSKLAEDSPERIEEAWIRWELEAKKEYAHRIAESLASGELVGSVAVGILKNYLTIHEPGEGRKDRLPVDAKWLKFCAGVEKLSLYVAPVETTIEQKREYLIKQCSRSLATVISAEGDSLKIVDDMWKSGLERMKPGDHKQIEKYKVRKAEEYIRNDDLLKEFIC